MGQIELFFGLLDSSAIFKQSSDSGSSSGDHPVKGYFGETN